MKHLVHVVLLAVAPSGILYAGNPADARSLALASIVLSNRPGTESISDQAALPRIRMPCFTLQATDPYGIPELAVSTLAACIPTAGGAFGFSYTTMGTPGYRKSEGNFAYGKSLGIFRAGIRIRTLVIRQYEDYGSAFAVVPCIAVQADPVKQLTLGIAVENPALQAFHPKRFGNIPLTVRTSAAITAGEDFWACVEMEWESHHKPVGKLGFEGSLNSWLTLRFGMSTSPEIPYAFGIGIKNLRFDIDVAAAHHPVLGYTPSLSLTWRPRLHKAK